jgi:hypothetical protein
MDTSQAIAFGEDYVTHWYSSYITWLWIGETTGVFIAVGSIIVSSSPSFIVKFVDAKTVAFFVAVAAALNSFLDPMGRAEVFGRAVASADVALQELRLDSNPDPDLKGAQAKIDKLKTAIADGTLSIRAKAVAHKPDTRTPTERDSHKPPERDNRTPSSK